MYSVYGITFDSRCSLSFGNGTARNVIIFGIVSSSSSHIDNRKNNLLISSLGPTYEINGIKYNISKTKSKTNFAWVYFIMMIIVICLLMEKK